MTTQDYSGIVRNIDLAWAAGTATPDAAADYVVFLDATDGAVKRCLVSAIGGGGSGSIRVEENGTLIGNRPKINFIGSGNINLNMADDTLNNRVNIEIESYYPTSLEALQSTTPGTDKLPYYNSSTTAATTDITTFGRGLIDDADATAARTTLGLASVASTASASDITTGTLGIARIPTGTTSSTVCIGNDARLSDDRTASGLRTDTTIVDIASSPAPTAGQVLVATSDISAKWDTLAGGSSTIAFADAPMSNTAINVTTYATLISKNLTISAGDTIELTAYGTLDNNSGATQTYRWQIALGSMTCEAIDGTTVATSATTRATFQIRATFSVASVSSAGAVLFAQRNAPANANVAGSIATTSQRYSWKTSASNLTGSQTVELQARSSTTTATQTLTVFSWSIRQLPQQL